MTREEIMRRARSIRLLALDVDGVLTDGGVYFFEDGSEFRRFDVKDGLGLKRLMDAGVRVAILSSAETKAVQHRAARLGIKDVFLCCEDKLATLNELCQRCAFLLDEVAYMGDDLLDLGVMAQVGLPCAPANAMPAVQHAALYVTPQCGGQGAVRDICDLIIEAQTS